MDPLTARITAEALRRNPELLEALVQRAHRERAEAMHRLIFVPIKKLFSPHATRPNLAHPRKAGGFPA